MNTNEIVEVVATEIEAKVESAPTELTVADLDWIGGGVSSGISY